MRYLNVSLALVAFFVVLTFAAESNAQNPTTSQGYERSSETLRGQKGLFHLLSADIVDANSYNLRTSVQYFQERGLLDDGVNDSMLKRTKTILAFGYAFTPHIQISAYGGFDIAQKDLRDVNPTTGAALPGGTETIDIARGGFSLTGVYDFGKLWGADANRLTAGASVWVDFSKISRFLKGPNIVPTLIVSTDFTDNKVVPWRAHANASFRPSNGNRYFAQTATPTDFDRFATETTNSYAIAGGLGIEFPVYAVTPSVEFHIQKLSGTKFSKTPMWVTPGLKGRPFPHKNIELFGAVDVGLSSFTATPAGTKPEVGAVPAWNLVLGFGISSFGRRAGEVGVDAREYESVKSSLTEKEDILAGLKRDLEFNTIQGRVIDAETKKPLNGVKLEFPENRELKSSSTDSEGKFIRYFKALPGSRIAFSKDGYDGSSKFLSLKSGERLTVDIELKKDTGKSAGDYVATVTDEKGSPLTATATFTNLATSENVVVVSDNSGQIYMKLPAGSYRLEMTAAGFTPVREELVFEKGKTVVRSYSLSRVAQAE